METETIHPQFGDVVRVKRAYVGNPEGALGFYCGTSMPAPDSRTMMVLLSNGARGCFVPCEVERVGSLAEFMELLETLVRP